MSGGGQSWLAKIIHALPAVVALVMGVYLMGLDLAIAQFVGTSGTAPSGPMSASSQKITELTPAASPGDALSYGQNLGQLSANQPIIAFVSEVHTATATASPEISINQPSPLATDDVLLGIITTTRAAGAAPTATGFTTVFKETTTGMETSVFCQNWTGSTGPYSWSWSGNPDAVGSIVALSGTTCAQIENYGGSATPAASATAAGVVTSHTSEYVIAAGANTGIGCGTSPNVQPGQILSSVANATAQGGLTVSGFINPFGTTPNVTVTNSCGTGSLSAQQLAFYSNTASQALVPVLGQANIGAETRDIVDTNLYGTDTVDCQTGGSQELTLNANETLTVNCSLPALSTATQRFELLICQDGINGNHTLTFANTNIRWSNGLEPGNTLTAGFGDRYFFEYDGTNLREIGFTSNVQCD